MLMDCSGPEATLRPWRHSLSNGEYMTGNSWLGVLVIRGSLVQFPAGALWSVLGQDSLYHTVSVYPAVKWVPSINKAVLRACALYAASCSGISPGGLKWFPYVQSCYWEEGCVNNSVDTRLLTEYLYLYLYKNSLSI